MFKLQYALRLSALCPTASLSQRSTNIYKLTVYYFIQACFPGAMHLKTYLSGSSAYLVALGCSHRAGPVASLHSPRAQPISQRAGHQSDASTNTGFQWVPLESAKPISLSVSLGSSLSHWSNYVTNIHHAHWLLPILSMGAQMTVSKSHHSSLLLKGQMPGKHDA